ncbi:MAG: 1-deoxy-D-xylulose-5-phosphate reductoisomerase [Bacteroidales bacterium]|nr:1-deoxy-D-xylulose-5-phosphate reductoisomerase [Bacteroidales bacterium]
MKDNKKHIAILGSTGSIGTQTLDVIRKNPELFCVEVLTANENADLLVQQALEFQPNCVVIANEQKYEQVKDALKNTFIKVFAGEKSIEDVVCFDEIDIVLVSLVGFSGLKPTISAIKAKKVIALANKETLVVGGKLITALAEENNVPILPVDSEHSAIFQCLQGEILNPVKRILLTASGGAFLGKKREELAGMKASDALKHPNWSMGKKVTIDSATLMNKGLEVIEARWLFGVDAKNIVPVIHPQSIVHSMVEFEDGSIKAQMGKTDMRLPILYALSYPKRVKMPELSMDIFSISNLTFSKPDTETFPCLSLAFKAIEKGGNLPTIMNAANEIAVQRFLEDKVSFLQIPEIIEKAMDTYTFIQCPTYEDFLATDKEVRESLAKIY